MRFAGLLILAVFSSVLSSVSTTQAQIKVAVIDMGAVFEAHPSFINRLEALKVEIRQFDENQTVQREALVGKLKEIRGMSPSSDLFRQGESEIANQTANLDVQKRLKARDFSQKEASIYYEVYQDVTAKVVQYANHYGIPTVVHFNSKPMTTDNPSSIMDRMNSNVVYSRPDWNITDSIIQMCGGQAKTASAQQADNATATMNR